MSRSIAAVLLLLLPATACANAGPALPGWRSVPVNFTFTVEQEYPDYEFYLQINADTPPVWVSLTPSTPVRLSGADPRTRMGMRGRSSAP
jgi:hypothetical protein